MCCEKNGDWRPLAEMYTVDATYGWRNGPNEELMAVGRDDALGTEMFGLDGWTYPYQKVIIDDRAGIGGSWFRYAGDWQWSWQRDFPTGCGHGWHAPPPGHYPRGESPVEIW